ncbi:Gamma-aminobutyric acid receptor subunit alpha-1 [Folsomia candida]|uniref:Gamma-aminobutyric acid receptor subunit alpha-1 n=2 Tax=Folsomia candida TaxID=158441 RepID=A0A226CYV1_FOLCA|nr:Gamma-aminobutyric acid receptor subunit alpha-1 [Folsomia candida]
MKVYMDKIKDIEAAQKGSKDRGGGGGGNNKPAAFNPYLEFYRNMALHKGDGGGLIYPREAWGPGGMMMAPPGLADFGAFAYPRHPNDEKPKERPSWVRIDRVSRVLFPLSFGVFNVTFWPYLIIGAENQ